MPSWIFGPSSRMSRIVNNGFLLNSMEEVLHIQAGATKHFLDSSIWVIIKNAKIYTRIFLIVIELISKYTVIFVYRNVMRT